MLKVRGQLVCEWGLTVSRTSSSKRKKVVGGEEISMAISEGTEKSSTLCSLLFFQSPLKPIERFQAAPQSLCNTVYKLISKILATIGLSLSSQSWPNQEAIVKSRHIGKGLIIAHENDPFYGP